MIHNNAAVTGNIIAMETSNFFMVSLKKKPSVWNERKILLEKKKQKPSAIPSLAYSVKYPLAYFQCSSLSNLWVSADSKN